MDKASGRPDVLGGITSQEETGCGNLYITVNFLKDYPMEVFIRMGKTGGCASSQNEALGRAISIGLQQGIAVEKYIHTLRGISCPSRLSNNTEKDCQSCADAVAKVLKRVVEERSAVKTSA